MRRFCILLVLFLSAGLAYSSEPVCLENDIIHDYMNDFSYDTIADYNVSLVMDYFNRPADYRKDAPRPVSLSWTKDPDAAAQRVEVSEQSDYSDSLVYAVSKDSARYDVYNLIPGKTYYYRVISVDATDAETEVGSGSFETTGTLRMILAEGTWNVRDMGGWISSLTGQPVAYGKIYRGAQLKAKGKDSIILAPQGIEALRQIGIRAELDLRSSDQVPSGVSALAVQDSEGKYDVDFNLVPEAVNARMYHFANNDANIRELQWIINRLKQKKPVYFHCQNGADRTGTLGFLIGALLGVSEGDLAKDYELTTFCEPYAAAYDPTEVGFARLRNYEGKQGSPLGSSEDNKEYMFAELANTMKTVSPANGTYQEKIYNFFRTGVNGTKISTADLSWFIREMTGYLILGDVKCDVDTIRLSQGGTHQIVTTTLPEGAPCNSITYRTTNTMVATVSDQGLVTAVGGGEAFIIVNADGIEVFIPVIVPITEDNIQDCPVENALVHRYMTEVQYGEDYSSSLVDKYDTVSVRYKTDAPTSATVKWMVNAGATNQRIVVSKNPDMSYPLDLQIGSLGNQDSTCTIDGLDPQTVYYYRVTATMSGSTVVLTSSAFRAAGTVSMLSLHKVPNVRDLGGWTGFNGHKVRYGVLYRGSKLVDDVANGGGVLIERDEISHLFNDLKIKAELDLRSSTEASNDRSTLSYRTGKFKRIPDAGNYLGRHILNGDAYIVALNQIITWVKAGNNVYMSGSLGVERTGTMAFLINGLLGVGESDLSKDYELSSFSSEKSLNIVSRRTDANYVDMVNKIKSLNGENLQHKIYKYFKEGVGGTSVPEADLKWFISYMLDCPESELENSVLTSVDITPVQAAPKKIYNLLGQEVINPGPGAYIVDGKKYIIR